MIVVDSSVWIDHLRNVASRQVAYLRHVIQSRTARIIVGDLVMCEVLQGVASDHEAHQVETALRGFIIEPMVGPTIAVQAAENYRILRSRGVTVRKTIDMLIGTYCMENRHSLLHSDRDYDHMEQHLGLLVLNPQPS